MGLEILDGVQTVLQGMGLVVFLLMAYKVYTVFNALCLELRPKCLARITDGRFWRFSISCGVRPYLLFADGKMVVFNNLANVLHSKFSYGPLIASRNFNSLSESSSSQSAMMATSLSPKS